MNSKKKKAQLAFSSMEDYDMALDAFRKCGFTPRVDGGLQSEQVSYFYSQTPEFQKIVPSPLSLEYSQSYFPYHNNNCSQTPFPPGSIQNFRSSASKFVGQQQVPLTTMHANTVALPQSLQGLSFNNFVGNENRIAFPEIASYRDASQTELPLAKPLNSQTEQKNDSYKLQSNDTSNKHSFSNVQHMNPSFVPLSKDSFKLEEIEKSSEKEKELLQEVLLKLNDKDFVAFADKIFGKIYK